jgi:tetratricopeptide (TPR) repeat protein
MEIFRAMDTAPSRPRDWLNNARAAVRLGKYPEALEQYDYFFEHALDDDPASFYGVRLSYCLDEWARLGQAYPPALDALEKKKRDARLLLEQTRNPARFHDLVSICQYLKDPDESIRIFLEYHLSDRELAISIVDFVWNQLVAAKQWVVCATYITDWTEKYGLALGKYDVPMNLWKSDKTFGGEDFDKLVGSWYVQNVSNIILVLRNTGRYEEVASVHRRMVIDMKQRDQIELVHQIDEHTRE